MSVEIFADFKFLSTLPFILQNVAGNFYRHLPSQLKMSLEISIDITFRTQNVVGNFYRHYAISELKMPFEISTDNTFKTVECSTKFVMTSCFNNKMSQMLLVAKLVFIDLHFTQGIKRLTLSIDTLHLTCILSRKIR